jgi:hypothetical protein
MAVVKFGEGRAVARGDEPQQFGVAILGFLLVHWCGEKPRVNNGPCPENRVNPHKINLRADIHNGTKHPLQVIISQE